MRILMVCLGNICRSPLAEGIVRQKMISRNLPHQIDSAGTSPWHAGNPPDSRAIKTAAQFGLDISGLRGRHFTGRDFTDFDLILPMDLQNMSDILDQTSDDEEKNKVQLFLEYAGMGKQAEVPDPYYGEMKDFNDLYRLLDEAAERMLLKLSK